MRKATKFAIAGAALLALGAAGIAAQASGDWHGKGGHGYYSHGYGGGPGFGKGGHRGGGALMMLRYFDTNEDGKISRAEIEQVRDDRFAAFDSNQDSMLNLEEFEGLWLDFMRERMVDSFQRLDADGDGQITLSEVNRRIDTALRWMDRNEDDVIDRSDFRRGKWYDRDDDDESEDDS